MERLQRTATKSTPEVDFNPETRILAITGDSYPENAMEFYGPVIEWMRTLFNRTKEKITLRFNFFFTSTSSSKVVTDILEMLKVYHEQGHDFLLEWYYFADDIDSQENAEIFLEDQTFPFVKLPYTEE